MSDDAEDDWIDYESGPFCQHWSDYSCEETCANCGHLCSSHWDDNACVEENCTCKEWKDKEEPKS